MTRKMLAVAPLGDPESGEIGVSVPQTQLFDPAAAVLHYGAVSRVMATLAARWPNRPRLGYSDDFGMAAAESTVREALRPSTVLNDTLGLELKAATSEWGARIEFLEAAVTSVTANYNCGARLAAPPGRGC